ncbi:5'-nucleotidase C-terminal domain-containing protein [Acuticoccus sp. I52.16.1]|uniref:5'-nucleotidase C-terminal domain-containing protein n=1 Tax=Acuticoccus sp. I52.16.1 TaxID=2928472 RepID=UPI001FD63096|nr:5'-nucleotidase C-terminal domain-containing protein [Acuticoccus sp. I52.16.1]UOM36002.1 5'-nucleotidase C-terminal domain-containing protein [Acuticoccus sp. I52.16.1]
MEQFQESQYSDIGRLLQIVEALQMELPDLVLGSYGRDSYTVAAPVADSPIAQAGYYYGSNGADTILGNTADDALAGGPRADLVNGRAGDDVVLGGNGNDTVRGHIGDDIVSGGNGNDLVLGGDGDDTISGEAGTDRLRGGAGDDLVTVGTGRNFVNGGSGEDKLVVDGLLSDYSFATRDGLTILVAKDGSARHLVQGVETIEDAAGNTVSGEDAGATTTLQLLHASDLEGNADAVDAAPNFATIVDALRGEYETTLVLSSGDNFIPSPFSNAAGAADPAVQAQLNAVLNDVLSGATGDTYAALETDKGRFDVAIMNAIGFDASALGNHEFDFGQAQLARIVGAETNGTATTADDTWTGALFPYLSANLEFESESVLSPLLDVDGVAADESGDGVIAPYAILEQNGETFGVIGATTQLLEQVSSTFGDPNNPNDDVNAAPGADDMAALAAVIQPIVDALEAQGVNKIILASHLQQFALENELATLLDGVDIYLAGGSDTIVADATDRLGEDDEAAADYPVIAKDAGGNDVAILSTDGQYSYVGRLVVDFDAGGNLIASSIDAAVSGAYITDAQGVLDVTGAETLEEAIAASEAGSAVQALTQTIDGAVLVTSGQNFFADQAVDLNGEREPGVRTEETNLGNLTADANLAYADAMTGEDVLVSIKNGGGIRASIPLGDGVISELEVQQVLAFNNTLSLISLTPEELVAALEHGVSGSEYDANGEPTNAQGRFPQVAGVRFSFDPAQPEGARIVDVIVEGAGANGEDVQILDDGVLTAAGESLGSIRTVTLNFLAGGGDGYPFADLANANRVDLFDDQVIADGEAQFTNVGTEQDALAEYLIANHGVDADPTNDVAIVDTSADLDTRIVNLAVPGAMDIDLAA